MELLLLMPNVTCVPFFLLVTTGYLVNAGGYLAVTSTYLITVTDYFWLYLVTARYFWFLVLSSCIINGICFSQTFSFFISSCFSLTYFNILVSLSNETWSEY